MAEQQSRGLITSWLASCKYTITVLNKQKLVLFVLILVGMALILLRFIFLKIIPWLQMHVKSVTIAIDAFIDIFTTIENIISIVVGAVKSLIHLFQPNKPPVTFTFHPYNQVSTEEVSVALTKLAVTCPKYKTMPGIMQFVLRDTLNPYVCPLIRAMRPTILSGAFIDVLGWASYDSDPYSGLSCTQPTDVDYDWACSGIGVGIVIIELFLPLYIAILILPTWLPTIVKTVVHLYRYIKSKLQKVENLIKSIETKIEEKIKRKKK